jgi:hypothetical protein
VTVIVLVLGIVKVGIVTVLVNVLGSVVVGANVGQ